MTPAVRKEYLENKESNMLIRYFRADNRAKLSKTIPYFKFRVDVFLKVLFSNSSWPGNHQILYFQVFQDSV